MANFDTLTTTTWNPSTHEEYDTLKGKDVFTSDGEKVGTIEAILHPEQSIETARGNHYFEVKPGMLKGIFGADEVYVPERSLRGLTDDGVVLDVVKDQLESQGWEKSPGGRVGYRRS